MHRSTRRACEGWRLAMNSGIQATLENNASASSALSGIARVPSGVSGAASFRSTFASSVSHSTANSSPSYASTIAGVKVEAKSSDFKAPGSNPKASQKEDAAAARDATVGVSATLPAPPETLQPTTLSDQLAASALASSPNSLLDSLLASGSASIPSSLSPQASAPKQSATNPPAETSSVQMGWLKGAGALETVAGQSKVGPAQLESSVTAPSTPVEACAVTGTRDSASLPSAQFPVGAASQNTASGPGGNSLVDALLGSVALEGCATPNLVSSTANPAARRESPESLQRPTAADVSTACATPAPGTGSAPAVGPTASHPPESVPANLENGLSTGAPFKLNLSNQGNDSSTSSSLLASSTSPSSSTSTVPAAGPSMRSDLGHKSTTSDVGSGRPSATSPAPNGAQNAQNNPPNNNPQKKDAQGPNSGPSEQPLHGNAAAAEAPNAAAQPVLPLVTATSVPADVAGQLEASRSAHAASTPDTASGPGAGDSPIPGPVSGEPPIVPAVGPVQMAQMVSRATQSEMRIGLNTSAFGAVEVRTLVRANDVGLAIGSERGDLRSLLASEIPGLANRLQQQSLRLGHVNFHESSSFSGNSSPEGNSQRRFFAQPARAQSSVAETRAETSLPGTTEKTSSRHAGLSVLA
jgi:hypothetical protein